MTKCDSGARSSPDCSIYCPSHCSHLYWRCDTHGIEAAWGASRKIIEIVEARHVTEASEEGYSEALIEASKGDAR